MHVVGHQHIGVHVAAGLGRIVLQQAQVDLVIGFAGEAGAAIVAPLDDVQGHRGKDQAGTSWHGGQDSS
jgi:hypothetical protein